MVPTVRTTSSSDFSITRQSNQSHLDLKAKPDKMNGQCNSRERTLLLCTKFQLNTTTNVLKLLHMDLTCTEGGENFNRKRYVYAKVVRTVCLHLEQSFQHARTLITPYVIRKIFLLQIRNREIHLSHHPNEGACQVKIRTFNEREPFFSTGALRNFFISTPS